MGIFDKIKQCQVLKESTNIEDEILELKAILEICAQSEKAELEQLIRKLEYGKKGEDAILFELKNSGFPMLVLQDLYFEHNGLSGQIDFLVLTKNKNYVLECKNMYGDVTVTESGEFMRKVGKQTKKIYSPITQCERHTDLIRKIRYDSKQNILTKALFEKFGFKNYVSLVVMANAAGKINIRYAPKDIKDKIISGDQLVRYIKKEHNSKDEGEEKDVIQVAEFFLSQHKENPQNYLEKYRKMKDEAVKTQIGDSKLATETDEQDNQKQQSLMCMKCGSEMVLRVAKRGNNIGEEFYGCSNFPKCRNIVKKE